MDKGRKVKEETGIIGGAVRVGPNGEVGGMRCGKVYPIPPHIYTCAITIANIIPFGPTNNSRGPATVNLHAHSSLFPV